MLGMTNYRNGPTTDHSGVVFDYSGLVLDRVVHFGTSYGISQSPSINRNEGVYRHNGIATVGLGLGLGL